MATLRTYSATVAGLDPLAHWRFNEDQGGLALDQAGALDGGYEGGVAHGAASAIGDGAVGFNGVDTLTRISTSSGDQPVRLGFLGDSLVEGFGLAPDDAFPAKLTAALEAQGFDIAAFVDGNSGRRSDQLIDDAQALASQNLDVVILVIGTNDALQGRDPAAVKADLKTIIESFQAQGTEVFLTPTFAVFPDEIFGNAGYDADPASEAGRREDFNAIFPALAAETGATLYSEPFVKPIADDPGAFNLVVGDDLAGGLVEGPERDGVHPSAAGVDEIVSRMLPEIKPLIQGVETRGQNLLPLDQGTIEMWIVPGTVDGRHGLVARDGAGASPGEFQIFIDNGLLKASFETAGTTITLQSGPVALQPNTASHIALAFGAAGVVLFLNGQAVDSSSATFSAAGNANDLVFAASHATGTIDNHFDGALDEVVIYDQNLTAQQVQSLFQAGQQGNLLVGTGAADRIIGGEDHDNLRGGDGGDVITGAGGNDQLYGVGGADEVRGALGDDLVTGGRGADRLFGGAGDDLLAGNKGSDRIRGGAGDDRLFGDKGPDRLFGNAGNDLLDGGFGRDRLTGGSGADTFRIERLEDGADRVLDFESGPGRDVLDLSAVLDGFDGDAALADFVRLVVTNGNTRVQVDPDGGGSDFQTAFNLKGQTGLDLDQLLSEGNVDLTGVA